MVPAYTRTCVSGVVGPNCGPGWTFKQSFEEFGEDEVKVVRVGVCNAEDSAYECVTQTFVCAGKATSGAYVKFWKGRYRVHQGMGGEFPSSSSI